ncbi:sulfite exporter TauE/SafE family protein [Kaarinaea lacus]
MIHDPLSYTTAFLIGLLGGAHCIGMCGGIMNALSFAIPEQQRNIRQVTPILLLYNFGRIFSYAIAGAIVGLLGGYLQKTGSQVGPSLRIFAGLMLIAMGLYLAGWWRGLTYLEKLGGYLWKYLQPIGNRLMPVTKPSQAALLGFIWGWLPCGLVYSTLTWSATSAHWQQSALIMLCFGLGTLPAMLLTGAFAHQVKVWIQKTSVRNIAALLIIGFGIWTMSWTLYHRGHKHSNDQDHSTHQQEITQSPHANDSGHKHDHE